MLTKAQQRKQKKKVRGGKFIRKQMNLSSDGEIALSWADSRQKDTIALNNLPRKKQVAVREASVAIVSESKAEVTTFWEKVKKVLLYKIF